MTTNVKVDWSDSPVNPPTPEMMADIIEQQKEHEELKKKYQVLLKKHRELVMVVSRKGNELITFAVNATE